MDDRVRGFGNGERGGRENVWNVHRVEVLLDAYRHLRWDGDAIKSVGRTFASDSTTDIFTQTNLLSAPQPPHRPPAATHSLVASPDSVRLTFTDVSYKFPQPPILTPWFLHPSNLVRLILRFKPAFVVWNVGHLHHRCQTTSSRSRLRGSIPADRAFSRLSSPNTTVHPGTM